MLFGRILLVILLDEIFCSTRYAAAATSGVVARLYRLSHRGTREREKAGRGKSATSIYGQREREKGGAMTRRPLMQRSDVNEKFAYATLRELFARELGPAPIR
jgi:hypothetical protein